MSAQVGPGRINKRGHQRLDSTRAVLDLPELRSRLPAYFDGGEFMTRTAAEAAANPRPTTITHNGERYVRLESVLAATRNHWYAVWEEWLNVAKNGPDDKLSKFDGRVAGAYGAHMAVCEAVEHEDVLGPTDADHDRETARLNRAADAQAHNQQIARGR